MDPIFRFGVVGFRPFPHGFERLAADLRKQLSFVDFVADFHLERFDFALDGNRHGDSGRGFERGGKTDFLDGRRSLLSGAFGWAGCCQLRKALMSHTCKNRRRYQGGYEPA